MGNQNKSLHGKKVLLWQLGVLPERLVEQDDVRITEVRAICRGSEYIDGESIMCTAVVLLSAKKTKQHLPRPPSVC